MSEDSLTLQNIKSQILTSKPSNVKDFVELFLRMYENDKDFEIKTFISVIREMNLKVFIANTGYEVDKSGLKVLLERRITQINLQIAKEREEREAKNLAWRVEQLNKKREEQAKIKRDEVVEIIRKSVEALKTKLGQIIWLISEIARKKIEQETLAREIETLADIEQKRLAEELEILTKEEKCKVKQQIEEIVFWKEFRHEFIESQESKYVEQFIKVFANTESENYVLKLQLLLKKHKWNFPLKQLKFLINEVREIQLYKEVKSKILRSNPRDQREIIENYLDCYRVDDFEILGALLKILREKGFYVENIFELETEIKSVAEEIELDKFEKLLFKDNEQSLFEDIDQLNGYDFEDFLRSLFSKMGYRVEQTRLSGDQGADLVVVKFGEKKVIQAKRFGVKVGNKAVQEIMAAISLYQAQKGMVVTNNYFTSAAIELANANNIELIDRDDLEELINKHW